MLEVAPPGHLFQRLEQRSCPICPDISSLWRICHITTQTNVLVAALACRLLTQSKPHWAPATVNQRHRDRIRNCQKTLDVIHSLLS